MDIALAIFNAISNVFSALSVAGGGPLYWIVFAALSGFIFFLGVRFEKVKNQKAWEDSKLNEQKEQTSNKTENNKIEESASEAENKIEEIRTQEPDLEKKERPPRG